MNRPTLSSLSDSNMSPAFSTNNVADSSEVNTEQARNLALVDNSQLVNLAHFYNLNFCETVLRMLFPAFNWVCGIPYSLFNRVNGVFSFGSKPKVFRINTSRVVSSGAVVKNAHSLWDWAFAENPRSDMGSDWNSGSESFGDIAVTERTFCASPKPTAFGLGNLRPKPILEVRRKALRAQVVRCNLNHIRSVCADWVTGPSALLFSQRQTQLQGQYE